MSANDPTRGGPRVPAKDKRKGRNSEFFLNCVFTYSSLSIHGRKAVPLPSQLFYEATISHSSFLIRSITVSESAGGVA